jgi:hypothetical protein
MQELRQLKQGMLLSSPSSPVITLPETKTSSSNTTSNEIVDPQTQTDNPIVNTSESISTENNTSSNSNEENTTGTGGTN